MRRTVSKLTATFLSLLGALFLWVERPAAEPATYSEYKAEKKQAFISKVRKDIEKVDRAIQVTEREILRSRDPVLLPSYRLQLAELHVELSRYHYFLAREESDGKIQSAAESPECKRNKEIAIRMYQRILSEFPRFEQNDRIRSFLAFEFRELGLEAMMLNEYKSILKDYPTSPLVPEAHLLAGNYYFDHRQLDQAKTHYEAVLQMPDNKVTNVARHKLAWYYINKEKFDAAFKLFEQVVMSENKRGDGMALDVRREALTDIVIPYTETRKALGSVEYFKSLAQTQNELTMVLDRLANRYFVTGQPREAAIIYRHLIILSHNHEKKIEYLSRLFKNPEAIDLDGPVDEAVEAMVDTVRIQMRSWRVPSEEKMTLLKSFEGYSRALATRFHAYLQSVDKRPKDERGEKIDPKLNAQYEKAARAYRQYLDVFGETPQSLEIRMNAAEAYFNSLQYVRAGEEYEKVARTTPKPALQKEAIYAAIVSFSKALQKPEKLSKIDLVDARNGFQTSADKYIELFPDSPQVAKIRFDRAVVFYKNSDYEKAVEAFNDYIKRYPNGKDVSMAAHLSLDVFVMQENFDGLSKQGSILLSGSMIRDPKLKKELADIVKNAEFKRIETASLEAASGEADQAAKQYLEFAQKYGETDLGEKALYNAYATAYNGKDYYLAYVAGNRLLSQYPKTEFAKEMYPAVGRLALQSGDFAQASLYFQRYVGLFPKDPQSKEFLESSARLYSGMGEYQKSNVEIARSQQLFGPSPELTRLRYENLERMRDWEQLATLTQKSTDPIGLYYYGLSLYRKRDFARARPLLERVTKSIAPNSENARWGAHAQLLLAELILRNYMSVRIKKGQDEGALLERKQKLLQALEKIMERVIGYNVGEWAIAALFQMGMAYTEFGKFLASTSIPAELSEQQAQEYKNLLSEQVRSFQFRGMETFQACATRAYELGVFTNYTLACANRGKEPLQSTKEPPRRQPSFNGGQAREVEETKRELLMRPEDSRALHRLAFLFLKGGDPHMSQVLFLRALELKRDDPIALNGYGVAQYQLNRHQEAFDYFELSASKDSNYAQAFVNRAYLRYQYRDLDGAKASANNARGLRNLTDSAPELIPASLGAIRQLLGQ